MNHSGIISDLLTWLEEQWRQPLSLDAIAGRIGYSKWHLQRKFKDSTGQVLGAYIRARRLSNAAMALRLTSQSLTDIALQYQFESQQAFTRAFKKQFQITPALYRRYLRWDFHGIQPPIGSAFNAQPQMVSLPALRLAGVTHSYTCTLEVLSHRRAECRAQYWRAFLREAHTVPPVLYGLCHSRPADEARGENAVFYTTAAQPEYLTDSKANLCEQLIPAGVYAQFSYSGPGDGLQNFIMALYSVSLPTLRLVRRDGCDIERYQRWPVLHEDAGQGGVSCDYFIPIMPIPADIRTPGREPAA